MARLAPYRFDLGAGSGPQGALEAQLLDGEGECGEQGYLAWVTATIIVVLGTWDPAPALDAAAQVLAAGERYADRDLRAVGLTYMGYLQVHQGRLDEGLSLLDEAMSAAGMLGPVATASVVCRTLSACVALQDYARATQWLAAMDRCANGARAGRLPRRLPHAPCPGAPCSRRLAEAEGHPTGLW